MDNDKRKNADDRRREARHSTEVDVEGRLLSPGQVDELLKSLAVPNMVTVHREDGRSARMASVDMSEGGLCLTGALKELGDEPVKAGDVLQLDIELKDEKPPLHAVARVAWIRDDGASVGRLGLEYLKLEVGGLERIRRWFNNER